MPVLASEKALEAVGRFEDRELLALRAAWRDEEQRLSPAQRSRILQAAELVYAGSASRADQVARALRELERRCDEPRRRSAVKFPGVSMGTDVTECLVLNVVSEAPEDAALHAFQSSRRITAEEHRRLHRWGYARIAAAVDRLRKRGRDDPGLDDITVEAANRWHRILDARMVDAPEASAPPAKVVDDVMRHAWKSVLRERVGHEVGVGDLTELERSLAVEDAEVVEPPSTTAGDRAYALRCYRDALRTVVRTMYQKNRRIFGPLLEDAASEQPSRLGRLVRRLLWPGRDLDDEERAVALEGLRRHLERLGKHYDLESLRRTMDEYAAKVTRALRREGRRSQAYALFAPALLDLPMHPPGGPRPSPRESASNVPRSTTAPATLPIAKIAGGVASLLALGGAVYLSFASRHVPLSDVPEAAAVNPPAAAAAQGPIVLPRQRPPAPAAPAGPAANTSPLRFPAPLVVPDGSDDPWKIQGRSPELREALLAVGSGPPVSIWKKQGRYFSDAASCEQFPPEGPCAPFLTRVPVEAPRRGDLELRCRCPIARTGGSHEAPVNVIDLGCTIVNHGAGTALWIAGPRGLSFDVQPVGDDEGFPLELERDPAVLKRNDWSMIPAKSVVSGEIIATKWRVTDAVVLLRGGTAAWGNELVRSSGELDRNRREIRARVTVALPLSSLRGEMLQPLKLQWVCALSIDRTGATARYRESVVSVENLREAGASRPEPRTWASTRDWEP